MTHCQTTKNIKELLMRKKIFSICFILLFLSLSLPAEEEKPLILVSNDDGIYSPGIKALAEEMTKLGQVLVVAPKTNRSGSSHSQNYGSATFYGRSNIVPGVEAYWVDNTPVNCISWAINFILEGRIPDLVVSGINNSFNPGESVHYSGTVGAAREGALSGAVALAVSYMARRDDNDDYQGVARITRYLAEKALSIGKTRLLWNVNFPAGKIDENRKIVVAKLSRLRWKTRYSPRKNLSGKTYFWYKANLEYKEDDPDSDLSALLAGAITVAPVLIDTTDYKALECLKDLFSTAEEKRE
jgi:5'-nucleotidase